MSKISQSRLTLHEPANQLNTLSRSVQEPARHPNRILLNGFPYPYSIFEFVHSCCIGKHFDLGYVIQWLGPCLGLRLRPVEERGSATGFAVLGWSYLILSIFPESRAQLPTSDLLAALEKRVSGDWRMGVQVLSLEMGPFPARHSGAWWEPVVTFKGGFLGSWRSRTSNRNSVGSGIRCSLCSWLSPEASSAISA